MGIFSAISAFFNKDKTSSKHIMEYRSIYPCEMRDCIYCVRYRIAREPMSYLGSFPLPILACIFCEKFEKKFMYIKKKDNGETTDEKV